MFLLLILSLSAFAQDFPEHGTRDTTVFVTAHPDDEALYSGTLFWSLASSASSKKTEIIYATNGAPENDPGLGLRREAEAAEGLSTLEKMTGRKLSRLYLDLDEELPWRKNRAEFEILSQTFARYLRGRISQAAARDGRVGLYVPHPYDTHPTHRALYDLVRNSLAYVPPAERDLVDVFGYIVHYGGRFRATGLGIPGAFSHPMPKPFALGVERVHVGDAEAVVKLDVLMAHRSQLERDDVFKLGTPLLTGYLAAFVTAPEILYRLPSTPELMPESRADTGKRANEFLHRFVGPWFGDFPPLERTSSVIERLLRKARDVLPEDSRAVQALLDAQAAIAGLHLRSTCDRVLHGPWVLPQ